MAIVQVSILDFSSFNTVNLSLIDLLLSFSLEIRKLFDNKDEETEKLHWNLNAVQDENDFIHDCHLLSIARKQDQEIFCDNHEKDDLLPQSEIAG